MTLEELKALLQGTGFPVAYRAFQEGQAPPLPFLCVLESGSNNFAADGIVFQPFKQIAVELYTAFKDPESEGKVGAVLTGAGICWESFETYIESEKVYQITFEIEV